MSQRVSINEDKNVDKKEDENEDKAAPMN